MFSAFFLRSLAPHHFSSFFLVAFLHCFLIFSLCLYNEAKHLALCRSDHFSCSFERVRVPESNFRFGVMTMLKKRSLCRSKYDFDVNSCLYLVHDAQAAAIRLLISVVLLLELSCLSEILRTFFYWQNLDFDVVDRVTSFLLFDQ